MKGQTATRTDAANGIQDMIGFFGNDPQMFGAAHLPTGKPTAAVLICPPIHAELFKSYRKEFLLGRALAARGVAAFRFHYRGTGNSHGKPEDVTVDTMTECAREATQALRLQTGVDRLAFVGTRLGAFPALDAAADASGAPVLLWAPVNKGRSYLNDALRSHSIAVLKGLESEPYEAKVEQLWRTGKTEVLGYELARRFFESLNQRSLTDRNPVGPVRVVPFGTRAEAAKLAAIWHELGVDISIPNGPSSTSWWLVGDETTSDDTDQSTQTLVKDGADWLIAKLSS